MSSSTKGIKLIKVLRQGDPLLSFLFTSYLIGMNSSFKLTCLRFADQILILDEKSWANIKGIEIFASSLVKVWFGGEFSQNSYCRK